MAAMFVKGWRRNEQSL